MFLIASIIVKKHESSELVLVEKFWMNVSTGSLPTEGVNAVPQIYCLDFVSHMKAVRNFNKTFGISDTSRL